MCDSMPILYSEAVQDIHWATAAVTSFVNFSIADPSADSGTQADDNWESGWWLANTLGAILSEPIPPQLNYQAVKKR
jgi:hypothetical protein